MVLVVAREVDPFPRRDHAVLLVQKSRTELLCGQSSACASSSNGRRQNAHAANFAGRGGPRTGGCAPRTPSQPCLSRLVAFRFRSNTPSCDSRRAQLEHTRVLRALPQPDRLARRLQDPVTDAAAQEAGGTYELAREHA